MHHYTSGWTDSAVDVRFTLDTSPEVMFEGTTVPEMVLTSGAMPVIAVTADFTVHVRFEAKLSTSSSWMAFNNLWATLLTDDTRHYTSLDFGFWYRY